MSYPVIQNIAPNKQQQQNQQQQQPQQFASVGVASQIQNINSDAIKQNVNSTINNQNNIVTQAAKQDNPFLLWGFMIPIWFGLSKFMDRFNSACVTRADGAPNLLDKVRDFGDRIGARLNNNNKLDGALKRTSQTGKKWIENIPILNAFFNTPTAPENSMARIMKGGTLNETAQDAKELIEAFIKNPDGKSYNMAKLKSIGLTVEEFEKMNQRPDLFVDRFIEICRKRSEFCRKQGISETIQVVKANTGMAPGLKNFVKDKIVGERVYTFLVGREFRFSEAANKLEALKGLKGNYGKTAVGKMLPKMFLRLTEGLTNGTAGGKIVIMMQAYCFADAAIRTLKAKQGEKGKTFIESVVNDLCYYLFIPLSLGIMHGFGGFKYIGMSKDKVETYRAALKMFNEKAAAGAFRDKTEYKNAKRILKDMLKGDTKLMPSRDGAGKTVLKSLTNVLYKPLKLIGRAVSFGLEAVHPYLQGGNIGNGRAALNKLGKMRFSFKRGTGYPLRFALGMFLIMPPLVKLAVKGCHAIFGRPSKSVLDEEESSETNQENSQPKVYPPLIASPQVPQSQQPQVVQQPVSVQQHQMQQVQPKVAQHQVIQPQVVQQAQAPRVVIQQTPNQNRNIIIGQPPQNNYLPPSPVMPNRPVKYSVVSNKTGPAAPKEMVQKEPVRHYIPSSAPVQVQPQQADLKVQDAWNRSLMAESSANKFV